MNRAERRRQRRAPLWATAILHLDRRDLGSFEIINLSAGGVLLSGDLPANLGAPVSVQLRLPGAPAVRTEAALVRRDRTRQGSAFALCFTNLSAEDEEVVQGAVLA